MRRAAWLIVLAMAAVPACSPAISSSADEPKGTDVDLDGVKATTPADWKKEEPSNSLAGCNSASRRRRTTRKTPN